MEDPVPFGGQWYFLLLAVLVFARGMDFLSTWIATPNLVLEGNPIAQKLGWKWGLVVNVALVVALAMWPLYAIVVATLSVLVAARNFQSAWLMRGLGETAYRDWWLARLRETRPPLFLVCLAGESLLTAAVGGAVIAFSGSQLVPLGIGMGLVAYGAAVAFYLWLAVGRPLRARERQARQRAAAEKTFPNGGAPLRVKLGGAWGKPEAPPPGQWN